MRRAPLAALACGTLLLATAALPAQQKAGPVVKKKVVSADEYRKLRAAAEARPAAGENTLKHGDFVTLSRRAGGRLSGVVVYAEQASDRLFVRPRSGAAPVAVSLKDVTEIERIVPAASTGASEAEITPLEIFNGAVRTVHFFAPTLSPGEKEQLRDLESAANKLAEQQNLAELVEEQMARGLSDDETGAVTVTQRGGFGGGLPYGFGYGGGGGYPYMSFVPFYRYLPYSLSYWPFVNYFPMYYGAGGVGGQSTVVVQRPSREETQANLMKQYDRLTESLGKARQSYDSARRRAVFDDEGRLIAVRNNEPMPEVAK